MNDINSSNRIQTTQSHTAAEAAINEWRRTITKLDWNKLPELLDDNVAYRNPASFDALHGKDTLITILRVVFEVFENFTYLRHFSSDIGYVLEFSARVGDENLFGVDLIEFDENGKITDLMVMIRPASVALTLATEVGKRLAASQTTE